MTRNTVFIAGVVVAFALGVVVGLAWRGRAESPVDLVATKNAASEGIAPKRQEGVRPVRPEIVESPSSADGTEPINRHAEWTIVADLKRRKLVTTQLGLIGLDRKISDNFVRVFDLTKAEHAALQAALDQAGDRLAELERTHATVGRDEKGIVMIAVTPFAEAGARIYDELMQTFAATLGEARYRGFIELGGEGVERSLQHFGAQERTLRFSYDPGRPNSPYLVRDDFKISARERDATTKSFQTRADMSNHLGTVTRLLPAEFGGPK